MSEEVQRRNIEAMLGTLQEMRKEYDRRLTHMENLLTNMMAQYAQLDNKYNLLLTARFNRGPTAE